MGGDKETQGNNNTGHGKDYSSTGAKERKEHIIAEERGKRRPLHMRAMYDTRD